MAFCFSHFPAYRRRLQYRCLRTWTKRRLKLKVFISRTLAPDIWNGRSAYTRSRRDTRPARFAKERREPQTFVATTNRIGVCPERYNVCGLRSKRDSVLAHAQFIGRHLKRLCMLYESCGKLQDREISVTVEMKVSPIYLCPTCGTAVARNQRFCSVCGVRLNVLAQP